MDKIKLTLFSLCVAQTIFGASLSWTNSGGGNWSDPNNWSPSATPQNGDSLTFSSNLVATINTTNDLAGLTLSALNLTGSNATFNISGNTINLQNGTLSFLGLDGTIFTPLVLTGDLTVNSDRPAFSAALRSTLSGTGGIIKIGTGYITYSTGAVPSYSGDTTVLEGSLEITGTGQFSLNGLVTLASGTSFVSSTTAGNPSVTVANITGAGDISLGRPLIINSTETLTLSGVISGGTQPLTKRGSGTLTFSGSSPNTHIGLTTVSEGTLIINKTVASPVTVSQGAFLKGTGTINGLTTVNGTVRPGNSIGPQNYGAGLTINDNGILAIEIDSSGGSTAQSQTSVAAVTGTATLNHGAILQVIGETGTAYSTSLTYPPFLTATAISGTFDATIPTNLPFVFSVNYTGTTATLEIDSIISIPTADLTGNNLVLANYLNTVGDYLVSAPAGWVDGGFTTLLGLSGDAQIDALERISPSRLTFGAFAGQNTAFQLSQLIALHTSSYHLFRTERELTNQTQLVQGRSESEFLAANDLASLWPLVAKNNPSEEPGQKEFAPATYSGWANGFGNFARQAAENQNPQFGMNTGGILVGFERDSSDLQKRLLDSCIFGGALGYTNTSIREDQHFGHGSTQSGVGSLYGAAYLNNGISYDFSVLGSYQRIESLRNVSYATYSAGSQSAHNGFGGNLHGGLAYEHSFQKWKAFALLAPFVNADWAFLSENAYTEHGSNSLNMDIDSRFSSMLRFEAGLNLYFRWFLEKGLLTLREKLSYVNKVPLGTGTLTAAVIGAPGSFTVTAFTDVQNIFSPSIELSLRSKRGAYLSLIYDGEFGSGYVSNQVAVKVGRDF